MCRPLAVERSPALRHAHSPCIVIANHTSHFDTPVVLSVLPERIRDRTAVAAAADRFYLPSKRGWWYSLFFNTFPIDRHGGGHDTLAYPLSLLRRGWSVLIYPEGTRSTDGGLGGFHHGVSVLALHARVPVVPVYTRGLAAIMPKGQRSPRPGPVHVRIGAPLWLEGGSSVPDATAQLERSMRDLGARLDALSSTAYGASP